MSLRVWLPLNGDTHNQGLMQLPTPTVNTFTFSNGGKIGGQSTSGSGKIAWHLTEDFLSNNKWTVATWIKATRTFSSANNIIFCKNTSASNDCQIYFSIVNGTSLVCGVNGPSSSLTTSYTFTVGTWYHVATTYNGSTVALYINGEQKATKTVTTAWPGEKLNMQLRDRSNNTAGTGSGGSAAAAYAFNDFRIYDHALSELEVKEIARAKVLHYPLNQFLPYQSVKYDKNIYTEPDGSKWLHIIHHNNPNGGVFSSTDSWESGVYIDENRWFDFYPIIRILNTYEFMVKQKTTSSAIEIKYRWIQNKSPLTATYNDIQPSNVTRITTTGYTDGNYGGLYVTNRSSHLCIANTNSSNWYGAFGCWTVYQNGIPGYPNTVVTTGYMDLYIKISDYISSIIEYDISGYCNNGTKVGTFTYSTDTPKYNLSTVFDGNSSIKFLDFNLGNVWSAGIWFYSPSTSTKTWSSLFTVNNNGGDSDLKMNIYYQQTNKSLQYSANGQYQAGIGYPDKDKWHQVFEVFDGTNLYCYLDGSLIRTKSITNSEYTRKNLVIGARSSAIDGSTTTSRFEGKLSDFRIYATALSAQDILSLYHNSALVDEQGIIHGAIH